MALGRKKEAEEAWVGLGDFRRGRKGVEFADEGICGGNKLENVRRDSCDSDEGAKCGGPGTVDRGRIHYKHNYYGPTNHPPS